MFATVASRWIDGLDGIRNVVRQELVAAQLAAVLADRPAGRVLDAGCGQGTQALRLARAGHTVTGLDTSVALLERFAADLSAEPADVQRRVRLVEGAGETAAEVAPGPYDVVLCHGVLMYPEDPRPLLGALTSVAGDAATLSLLVRNGLATAMRDGLRGRWSEASAAFDRPQYTNRLGLPARAHTPAELDALLAPLGWQRERWYGVRVFCDHRDEPAPTGAGLEQLLAAEHEAGRRSPYRDVAALAHLVYAKAASASSS